MKNASKECEPVWCDAEDELFILYTSGSTGKPKVHYFILGYCQYLQGETYRDIYLFEIFIAALTLKGTLHDFITSLSPPLPCL